jgi:hypothetical protein
VPQNQLPFFSVCIPQYNRTSFLIEALRVLAGQTLTDFEVCISDDCSTDGRQDEVVSALDSLGVEYAYYRQPSNLRYDGNLRAALELARGRYCLLMGNDDCLASPHVLRKLLDQLSAAPNVGAVVTNYVGGDDQRVSRRVRSRRLTKGTPMLAAQRFRNFSFVSGVLLRRDRALAHATAAWDGAEMYQMFLGSRIIAEGYELLELEDVTVVHGLQIRGETVDSYASRPRVCPCPITERPIPLGRMGALVYDAIRPFAAGSSVWAAAIFLQIILFTYSFWIVEYRRVQSWPFAAGICLGLRPGRQLQGVPMPCLYRALLDASYLIVTLAGLLIPIKIFDRLRPRFYDFAKAVLQIS